MLPVPMRAVAGFEREADQRSGAVCRALARLHDDRVPSHETFSWDYETELAGSALSTLELAIDARMPSGERWWRRVGDLRRVVTALSGIRRRPPLEGNDGHPFCLSERHP